MTPKDYSELVELMARAHWNSANAALPWNKVDKQIQIYRRRDMSHTLDAMQAAGVAQVPMEATEEMMGALNCDCVSCKRGLNAAIAANPYNK